MKLLVVGVAGQVGGKISSLAISRGFAVYGTYKTKPAGDLPLERQFTLDKTVAYDVERIVSETRPDVVVDTGALHNVDYCEAHPDEAYAINRDGTRNLSSACNKVGAKFVFVSTDYVFDGEKGNYAEQDATNPESVYAKSKLEGETAALTANDGGTFVCRPSVIYSSVPAAKVGSSSSSGKPLNFGAWVVSQLSEGKDVSIVTDQIGSPTLADDLARAILAIAESENAKGGVYHTAGATRLSRFDFTVALARKLGFDQRLVHPVDSSKFKQAAKRPHDSSLVSKRLADEVGYEMLRIEDALDEFVKSSRLGKHL